MTLGQHPLRLVIGTGGMAHLRDLTGYRHGSDKRAADVSVLVQQVTGDG